MRNKPRRSNPVGWVAVEGSAASAAVQRGMSATSALIPPTPEDSQPATVDSGSQSLDVVTTSRQGALPVSEPGYLLPSATVGANPRADPDPTSAG